MIKQALSARKVVVSILLACMLPLTMWAVPREEKVKPVKNVILMISDGTSLSAISLARWYQRMVDPSKHYLNMDPYLSGTILTYCSNAPIGDSAPTTSTFMNGVPSIQAFINTYPWSAGEDDIVPLDSAWEYRPLMTLMDATRILQGRKTGVVMTSEFPHATPADCISRTYKRGRYDWIIPQYVTGGTDVVIGGGTSLLSESDIEYLKANGYGVFLDDHSSLSTFSGERLWSLFNKKDVPYHLDREEGDPSLAEMTATAIRVLDTNNDQGFMLMVEGSKVDWAAHANDAVGIATDILGFDEAVGVALDFAKRDGNTVVILTSDHGNSGIAIGTNALEDYAGTSARDLFGPLTKIKKTADGLAQILAETEEDQIKAVFKEYTTIELTDQEVEAFKWVKEIAKTKRSSPEREALLEKLEEADVLEEDLGALYSGSLSTYVSFLYKRYMPYIGFTTHGHTGEETFLAVYAPTPEQRLTGFNTNIELHQYMHELLGLSDSMLELSDVYFAPHTEVFAGMDVTITGDDPQDRVLTVKHNGKTFRIQAFYAVGELNGAEYKLPVANVYVDKKDTFYLPTSLKALF